jgi:hypothetical protein
MVRLERWTNGLRARPIPFLKKLLGGKELVYSLSTFSKVARTVSPTERLD